MSLPRMSWHIGDYKRDTGHLRTVEHGAYFLLIMHYWARGALPNDDGQLARIAGMTDKEWRVARPTLAAFFQPGWRHGRVEDELAAARERSASAATSASHRWSKRNASAHANASQSHSEGTAIEPHPIRNAIPSPSPSQEERKISPSARAVGEPTRTQTKARIEQLFEELWAKKPKRDGANPKMPALKKFLQLLPLAEQVREAAAREIIDACGRWADTERKSGREGTEKVAQLITWLNQSRWVDYQPEAPAVATAPVGFYATDESPELDAWDAHYRTTKGINAPRDNHFGWRFPTQWPPGHEVKNGNGAGADGAQGRAQAGSAGVFGGESPRQTSGIGEGADGRAAAPARPPGGFTIE